AYGPAAGLINATSRRGSNEVQAEGFALFRDKALNATGAFEAEKPKFRRLHVGAAVGGPIERDRTHYFLAYERKSADFFRTVLTNGAFPGLEGTFEAPLTDDLFFARVDHRLNDRNDFSLRWAGRETRSITGLGPDQVCGFLSPSGMGTREFVSDTPRGMQSVLASHIWTPRTSLQNSLRVHWLRNTGARRPRSETEAQAFPSACRGSDFFAAESVTGRTSVRNDLAWGVGRHRLQFGVSVARAQVDTRSSFHRNGTFVYGMDDDALPDFAVVSVQGLSSQEASTQWGLYVEDRWSVSDRLTLTFGLRYDAETNGSNQHNVSELAGVLPFVPTEPREADLNNLAPRIGLSWRPTRSRAVMVRGGLGVYYGTSSLWYGGLESKGQLVAFYPGPGVSNVEDLPVDPATIAEESRSVLGQDWDAVRTVQGSLGLDWGPAADWVVTLEGVASKSANLPIQRQVNGTGFDRNYPGFGDFWQVLSAGLATSQMATLGVRWQTALHFLDIHYTLSRSESTNDLWFFSIPEIDLAVTDFEGELGRSAWDERHRLVGVLGVDGPLRTRLGMKLVYSSSRPFDPLIAGDPNGDNTPNDRPVSLERNSGEGRDFASLDLSLSRIFRLGAGELEARVNVFNATNRTNFTTIDRVVGSPTFGEPLGAHPRRQVEIGFLARY
ncbi:MAG: TonB-dependent receptor, partial [Gemmatimonadetes bacterium]|nr:TonB-dependent receptor [Gemmatimonadota bacterium]